MAEELIICNTRNSHALHLPFCLTKIKQFSVFLSRTQILQHLTTEIINSSSPASFKKALKVTEQVRGCVAENHPHGYVIFKVLKPIHHFKAYRTQNDVEMFFNWCDWI